MKFVLRNVHPWGAPAVDVSVVDGQIKSIGVGLPRGGQEVDGSGTVLLPGIHDHHLHLMAIAARRDAVSLSGMTTEPEIVAALRASNSSFVCAVDYNELTVGLPDAALLDRWLPDRSLRLANRTGGLWVLNSAAMRLLGERSLPSGAERGADGKPTGRFWREDRWLRSALALVPPDLSALGGELAALGLTGLTDATAHNGPEEAAQLVGRLPQRLHLMGSETLKPCDGYELGALKLMLDERQLPDLAECAARIARAHSLLRPVAAHCVTEAELAFYLAALDAAGGARAGDRVEHGSLIPPELLAEVAAAKLTVVTNPAFIHDHGERFRQEVEPEKWNYLYPAADLIYAGVPLLIGSDAPYASVDPWAGMRAMRSRRTADGNVIGEAQQIAGPRVLHLYCHGTISARSTADLILCRGSLSEVVADLSADRVCFTMIGGEIAFNALG